MIAARQELDERRPLWRLDAPAQAALALSNAQATQSYAGLGLGLWPTAVTARLVEAQLAADGTYPNAAALFAEGGAPPATPTVDVDPDQPRDGRGQWRQGASAATLPAGRPDGGGPARTMLQQTAGARPDGLLGLLSMLNPIGAAQAQEVPQDDPARRLSEPTDPSEREPGEVLRLQRLAQARRSLEAIDPTNRELEILKAPGDVPTEADIERMERAAREAAIARTCDFLRPDGRPIGERGTSSDIRLRPGGLVAAQSDFDYLSVGGTPLPMPTGSRVQLPGEAGFVMLRPVTSTSDLPAIDVDIPNVMRMKIHY